MSHANGMTPSLCFLQPILTCCNFYDHRTHGIKLNQQRSSSPINKLSERELELQIFLPTVSKKNTSHLNSQTGTQEGKIPPQKKNGVTCKSFNLALICPMPIDLSPHGSSHIRNPKVESWWKFSAESSRKPKKKQQKKDIMFETKKVVLGEFPCFVSKSSEKDLNNQYAEKVERLIFFCRKNRAVMC